MKTFKEHIKESTSILRPNKNITIQNSGNKTQIVNKTGTSKTVTKMRDGKVISKKTKQFPVKIKKPKKVPRGPNKPRFPGELGKKWKHA